MRTPGENEERYGPTPVRRMAEQEEPKKERPAEENEPPPPPRGPPPFWLLSALSCASFVAGVALIWQLSPERVKRAEITKAKTVAQSPSKEQEISKRLTAIEEELDRSIAAATKSTEVAPATTPTLTKEQFLTNAEALLRENSFRRFLENFAAPHLGKLLPEELAQVVEKYERRYGHAMGAGLVQIGLLAKDEVSKLGLALKANPANVAHTFLPRRADVTWLPPPTEAKPPQFDTPRVMRWDERDRWIIPPGRSN